MSRTLRVSRFGVTALTHGQILLGLLKSFKNEHGRVLRASFHSPNPFPGDRLRLIEVPIETAEPRSESYSWVIGLSEEEFSLRS